MVPKQKITLSKSEIIPKLFFSTILEKYYVLLRLMYIPCQGMRKEKFSQMKTNNDVCSKFFLLSFHKMFGKYFFVSN